MRFVVGLCSSNRETAHSLTAFVLEAEQVFLLGWEAGHAHLVSVSLSIWHFGLHVAHCYTQVQLPCNSGNTQSSIPHYCLSRLHLGCTVLF